MTASIVCAIDDSLHARAAARVARDLADRLGLRLVAVHALTLPTRGLPDVPIREVPHGTVYEAERGAAEEQVAEVLRSAGVEDALRRVVPGPAANVLTDASDAEEAALIVVGTPGPSTLRTALTGSLTAALFRNARRPVVAIPPRAVAESPPPVRGPVLAAVGSPADARWVRTAAALARTYRTPLVLAHALADDGPQPQTARARAAVEAFDPARLALATRLPLWRSASSTGRPETRCWASRARCPPPSSSPARADTARCERLSRDRPRGSLRATPTGRWWSARPRCARRPQRCWRGREACPHAPASTRVPACAVADGSPIDGSSSRARWSASMRCRPRHVR